CHRAAYSRICVKAELTFDPPLHLMEGQLHASGKHKTQIESAYSLVRAFFLEQKSEKMSLHIASCEGMEPEEIQTGGGR
ncbi:MAG: hypothetical protein OXB86_01635, partial [Bdellovibrionales bacterium]|nr:hypothetical protein [Bdellovibrionales bacterium]